MEGYASAGGSNSPVYFLNLRAVISVDIGWTGGKTYKDELFAFYKGTIRPALMTAFEATYNPTEYKTAHEETDIDIVRNIITVAISMIQPNSSGYISISNLQSVRIEANTLYDKKPDGKSSTFDLWEPGATAVLTQNIKITSLKAVNMYDASFDSSPKWNAKTGRGWKMVYKQPDVAQEVVVNEVDGIHLYIQGRVAAFQWVAASKTAKYAPGIDIPQAQTGNRKR
jgi:hypothetical protein